MEKYKLKIKIDLVYLFLILLVTEIFNYLSTYTRGGVLIITATLGVLLLETWIIKTFIQYSGRKVSQYSDVIVRISLRNRFFAYFILPLVFYLSLLAFLFFNKNLSLSYVVMGVCIILILILFLNIKSSLNKIYTISLPTRAIFDFLCISILYLLVNVYVRISIVSWLFFIIVFFTAFILLLSSLKLHSKLGGIEILVAFLSALFISIITFIFLNTNIFIIPAISSLAFYLVISMWNIRFVGKTQFSDYLLPFLYVVLALVLILNI